jgi:hypothetical protein
VLSMRRNKLVFNITSGSYKYLVQNRTTSLLKYLSNNCENIDMITKIQMQNAVTA